MNFTKKIDRAFQWAGEKMGAEAKTAMTDDFKMLETEMALRHDGMDRLHKSMNAYVKWVGRRGEVFEDKEKGLPVHYLGRTMTSHGEDFESDSEFGNSLIAMGQANERLSAIQETYVADATTTWLESLERSLAMMKEYQASRKKLENRRLAYDASITKLQKAKRDDFRIEEELRTAKAKYEESSEDVLRRMQDIKDAEVDTVRDLTHFLDAELEYHERCAEELRRVRQNWSVSGAASGYNSRPPARSRSNTTRSFTDRLSRTNSHNAYEAEQYEPEAPPVRMAIRSNSIRTPSMAIRDPPDMPVRPALSRANTVHSATDRNGRVSGTTTPGSMHSYNGAQNAPNVGTLRGQLRPVSRIHTARDDVFGEAEYDTASGSGSPEYGERSASPATSFGSLSRSTSNIMISNNGAAPAQGARKAPPPPPPSRSKKPPPPVPAKREALY
ncbi:BAR-domain-containing protein [Thozetella sp. PMI_491]|nr:BAR-domain-containing protein [Thozetella sp. PMI_491]